ncbi:MAG: hypothetical protein UZ15_CFX003003505 [Chloroflexi bacterium OLB15]|nr:MAG: hypothetical protein UZ15_CFX003003505 [Chloroflexi bacterium OLB15]
MLVTIVMKLRFILAATLVCMVAAAGYASAQDAEITPEATPQILLNALPPLVRLEGLTPVYQDVNRCSAAALSIQLSYYDWGGTYTDTIHGLNPHAEDVAVRLDEMISFANGYGLEGIERTGGTLDMLKRLVAAGFPVLIENSYFEGAGGLNDWMGHNRVVMGYDDAQGAILTFDSLLGNGPDNTGRPIPYTDVDERWRTFNRDYLVLYRPEQEALLQQVMGDQWDTTINAEWTLEQSQAEVGTPREDSFTWFNIGTALLALNRNEEAAQAFDAAINNGLPWRMMWYQYGPLEAYLRVGRYADVITHAARVISTTPGVKKLITMSQWALKAWAICSARKLILRSPFSAIPTTPPLSRRWHVYERQWEPLRRSTNE